MPDWIDERGLAYEMTASGQSVSAEWAPFAWRNEPRVLAVLRSARALVEQGEPTCERRVVECVFCGANRDLEAYGREDHKSDCAWQQLVAALEGGE